MMVWWRVAGNGDRSKKNQTFFLVIDAIDSPQSMTPSLPSMNPVSLRAPCPLQFCSGNVGTGDFKCPAAEELMSRPWGLHLFSLLKLSGFSL